MEIIDVEENVTFKSLHDAKIEFSQDIRFGLSKTAKQIPSKYLYDDAGCELFNKITRHPDYYLTNCEIEILQRYKQYLFSLLNNEYFNLVELGPGEGIKTQILLEQCLQEKRPFAYLPIDISLNYLKILTAKLKTTLARANVIGIHADYLQGLEWLKAHSKHRNLVLFLGSSIGNYDALETLNFLKQLRQALKSNDLVLIGFDLRKNIDVLLHAYNDSAGITREFNFNLLQRINHELQADFNLAKFYHYPTYNVVTGAMESYLVSLDKQVIQIDAIQERFSLMEYEAIYVECSHKYTLSQIDELATHSGFKLVENFRDLKNYFVNSLWCAK